MHTPGAGVRLRIHDQPYMQAIAQIKSSTDAGKPSLARNTAPPAVMNRVK
jgi:hypothetical protein